MNLRLRLLKIVDGLLAALILVTVTGTSLAFGGAVWWAKPALAVTTSLMIVASLARCLLDGRWIVLKSPLAMLGLFAIGLALIQLTPMPGRIASLLSPQARAAHALGTLPDLAKADDPDAVIPESAASRTPATLDRPATLRWMIGAAGCLALFCVCSHFADRLGHSTLIWGSVVAAFFAVTAFGLVQMTGGVSGLYGAIDPGSGRPGMPSLDDLSQTPGFSVLRPIGELGTQTSSWHLPRAERPFLFGSLMGGAGAYLALGALALPLSLGLSLQILAPRGVRQGMRARLRESGRTGLITMMVLISCTGAALIGQLSGPVLCIPFAVGILLVGIPAAWPSGLRWVSVALTMLTLTALGAGVAIGESSGRPRGVEVLSASSFAHAKSLWADSARIARDFPIVGSGLGTYPVIASYYKSGDVTRHTAQSSLLQWWVESGVAGLLIFAAAAVWCVWKLPGAIRRVGSADLSLAFMMIGTMVCFAGFSLLHWSVELAAVAVAACAVGGTLNRWLAGGTDLFVERA